jgi:hypothetical protein
MFSKSNKIDNRFKYKFRIKIEINELYEWTSEKERFKFIFKNWERYVEKRR